WNIYSYDCCYFIINEGKIIVKYLLMIIMSILLLTACDAAEEETDEGNDEAEEDVTPDGESESDSDVGEAMDNAVVGIVNKADGTRADLPQMCRVTAMDGDEYLEADMASGYGAYGAYADCGITVPDIYE